MFKSVLLAMIFAVSVSGNALASNKIMVKVNGLVCDFCIQSIGMMLKKEASVASSTIDMKQKFVIIHTKNGKNISDQRIAQLIEKAGYTVVSVKR